MSDVLKVKLTGDSPLIMHNSQLVDPLNKFTKALKAATKASNRKTEEGLAEIRRLEWIGSLYQDENGVVGIPSHMVLAMTIAGAKKSKQGGEAKAGVYGTTKTFFPLEFKGPKDIKKLYDDERFVSYVPARVGQARVMRCRPIFKEWSVTVELLIDTEVMDREALVTALTKAGSLSGLGDWRPQHGRFSVEVMT